MKKTNLEIETDRLMGVWAREYRSPTEGGYAATPIDGNLALLETRNYRNRPPTAQGVETRAGKKGQIYVSDEADMMENLLGRVGVMNHKAVLSLTMYYLYHSTRVTAIQMGIGKTYARQLKEIGFNMVMVELSKA